MTETTKPAMSVEKAGEEPITDSALEAWCGVYTMSRKESKWFYEATYARIVALRAELAAEKARRIAAEDECQQYANEQPKLNLTNVMLRAEVERLKAGILKRDEEAGYQEVLEADLRAELAAGERFRKALKGDVILARTERNLVQVKLATEKAAREKAEARVRELQKDLEEDHLPGADFFLARQKEESK